MIELQVLQYNVYKRKDIIVLLLGDQRTREIDIIAIQEPWLNLYILVIYCPSSCPFTLVFFKDSKRSYLIVNKKLDINY